MTLMVAAPGLRDAVQIAGYSFAVQPTGVQAAPVFLENVDYFIDGSAHVDRPLQSSDAVLGVAKRPVVNGEEALAVLELALAVDDASGLPSLS